MALQYKARKNRDVASNEGLGRAALVIAAPQLSFTSQIESSSDETHLNDQDHFIEVTQPRRTDIANANGVTYPVTGAGTVVDILTKEIIGRGTKKGGLYYMDDFSSGQAHHMHHASIKKR
ncbi:hypothetical protein CK203_029055 [Vitis vinifera]|uniref:Uncharacterized protein n=1 Tax=Vitis vinifera TaxID=29760 RepID=A0A438IMN9_VITVI|nr:hypothetical protein CK203_029055 [Vitis vinifera]